MNKEDERFMRINIEKTLKNYKHFDKKAKEEKEERNMNQAERIKQLELWEGIYFMVMIITIMVCIFVLICMKANLVECQEKLDHKDQQNYILNDRIYCNQLPTGWDYTFADLELSPEQINEICEILK